MNIQVQSLVKYISTALALHVRVNGARTDTNEISRTGNRRLLSDKFPSWLSADDRRFLLASPADIKADAVVALDGTGTHTSINEAIAFVTSRGLAATEADGGGTSSNVIYVKSGTYKEILRITNKQTNVKLMGDGKGKSIIVGDRSAGDGYSTYDSATVGTSHTPISLHIAHISSLVSLMALYIGFHIYISSLVSINCFLYWFSIHPIYVGKLWRTT